MTEATEKIDKIPQSKRIIFYAVRILAAVVTFFILGWPSMDSYITFGFLFKFGAVWITSFGAIFLIAAAVFVVAVFIYSRLRKQPSDDEET